MIIMPTNKYCISFILYEMYAFKVVVSYLTPTSPYGHETPGGESYDVYMASPALVGNCHPIIKLTSRNGGTI